jgi:hypothetical protein
MTRLLEGLLEPTPEKRIASHAQINAIVEEHPSNKLSTQSGHMITKRIEESTVLDFPFTTRAAKKPGWLLGFRRFLSFC